MTQAFIIQLAACRKILLLQGPIGAFFQHLSAWLQQGGSVVYKINFQGGDEWDYPKHLGQTFAYTGKVSDFDAYFANFVQEHQIDAVVCHGDTRIYHKIAKTICQQQNISFWAFEEGYYRPFWVTLEKDGVNDFSSLPKDIAFFQAAVPDFPIKKYQKATDIKGGFFPIAKVAMLHYFAMQIRKKQYPNYQHHRETQLWYYIKSWIRALWRKKWYQYKEASIAEKIENGNIQSFFILPLQVSTDSQIHTHSNFSSMQECLLEVMQSFAQHAPKHCQLIVKHHPMDRGFTSYRRVIDRFIAQNPDVFGRIIYVHDITLPTLMRKAIGMVTINSTSGMSAMLHKLPVKVIGRAHYDMQGLTDQQPLSTFWQNPVAPDMQAVYDFRLYHINYTQLAGSFYHKVKLPDNPYQKTIQAA